MAEDRPKVRVNFLMDEAWFKALESRASADNRNISSYIRHVLYNNLRAHAERDDATTNPSVAA